MTMHACERARARYLNDRVRCKMSTVAPNLNGLTQCPVECATLRCTCSVVLSHRHPPSRFAFLRFSIGCVKPYGVS